MRCSSTSLRDPRARREAVVVEDHDAARREPRPDPLEDVLRRLVDVDVAVAEPERAVGDLLAGVLGKDPLQQLDVLKPELADELLDDLARRVVVLAVAVVGVDRAGLDDALSRCRRGTRGRRCRALPPAPP